LLHATKTAVISISGPFAQARSGGVDLLDKETTVADEGSQSFVLTVVKDKVDPKAKKEFIAFFARLDRSLQLRLRGAIHVAGARKLTARPLWHFFLQERNSAATSLA
jgi:hypothetical protein